MRACLVPEGSGLAGACLLPRHRLWWTPQLHIPDREEGGVILGRCRNGSAWAACPLVRRRFVRLAIVEPAQACRICLQARNRIFEFAHVAFDFGEIQSRLMRIHLSPQGEARSLIHDLPHLGGIFTGIPDFPLQKRVVIHHVGRLDPRMRLAPQT